MADSVVIYKDPNKKSNTGVIIAIIVVFVFIAIAIVGILASIVLVSLNSAKEKASEAAVTSSVRATQIGVILCADEGLKISSPSNGANICNSKEGNFIWGDLSGQKASWGGCQEDLDLSDNEFKYCATTSSGKIITCTSDGCAIEGEGSSVVAPIEEANTTNNEGGAITGETTESEFEIVLVGVIKNLDTETGAGSNIAAASNALDQNDLVGARQQFIWAKEKIVEAQNNLKSVTPLENEKASYNKIDSMLNEYIRGLDTIVSGIDKGNETLMLEGINIIKETSQSAAAGA